MIRVFSRQGFHILRPMGKRQHYQLLFRWRQNLMATSQVHHDWTAKKKLANYEVFIPCFKEKAKYKEHLRTQLIEIISPYLTWYFTVSMFYFAKYFLTNVNPPPFCMELQALLRHQSRLSWLLLFLKKRGL